MMFALVDRYTGIRLGLDLGDVEPGKTRVVESERRLACEPSYGHVHALWYMCMFDGRHVVSVPPGSGGEIEMLLRRMTATATMADERLAASLRKPVDRALSAAGLHPVDRLLRETVFACNADHLRPHPVSTCRRLTDDSVPASEGIDLPKHCFPDGIVYGVVVGNEIASCALAHRAGIMEDVVCDVGVETASAHRRRGYAKATVSALVNTFTDRGGEARYACSPDNEASIATARSIGFAPYAECLILSASRSSEEEKR